MGFTDIQSPEGLAQEEIVREVEMIPEEEPVPEEDFAPEEEPLPEEPAPEEEPPGCPLELPPEHPLNLLWNLWAKGREETPPAPRLSLKEVFPASGLPQTPLLSLQGAEKELPRLEQQLKERSLQRLNRLRPSEDGTPPDVDAEAQVFLTLDQMTAWLLVYPPSGGGAGVTRKTLEEALRRAKVCFGVEEELLDSLSQPPGRYFRLGLAARGEPPVPGKDGSIIDLFSRELKRTFKEDDTGRVDYASFELFQNVRKDEAICRIILPTGGEPGRSVLDRPVPPRPGKAPYIPRGQNTRLSEDRGSLLASCEGHIEFANKCFQVKPVLEIRENVDFSTGNIKCNGDVHIFGDVRGGFSVSATGSITVDGVVEASCLEAGGDVVVRKGVQGNDKAVIRARRSVFARYLESCVVYARQNLECENIVSGDIYCDDTVKVRSGRGSIFGGLIHAGKLVSARIVGTPSEAQTRIILGGRPCEESERKELAREIAELEVQFEKIERQPESPGKLNRMTKTRVRISANRMKLDQLDRELDKLPEEERNGKGQLECDTVYPGVEITMGAYFLKVSREQRRCRTSISGGDLTLIAAT